MPHDVISQAIVATMLRYHIDADAAQTLVTQLSTHQQQPLIDVARDLIAKFSVPTTADPSPAEASAQPEPTVYRRSRQGIDVRLAALIRDVQDRRPNRDGECPGRTHRHRGPVRARGAIRRYHRR